MACSASSRSVLNSEHEPTKCFRLGENIRVMIYGAFAQEFHGGIGRANAYPKLSQNHTVMLAWGHCTFGRYL